MASSLDKIVFEPVAHRIISAIADPPSDAASVPLGTHCLFLIITGRAWLYTGESGISLDAGDLCLLSRDGFSSLAFLGPHTLHCIWFRAIGSAMPENDAALSGVHAFQTPHNVPYAQLFHELFNEYCAGRNHSAEIGALIQLLYAHSLRRQLDTRPVNAETSDSPTFRNDLNQYIQQNLLAIRSIDQIAHDFHYHPKYFMQLVKRKTGCTTSELILRARIDYACELLVSSVDSVADIAVKSGFSSSTYFFRSFKRYTGMTPTQYRAKKS